MGGQMMTQGCQGMMCMPVFGWIVVIALVTQVVLLACILAKTKN